MSPGSLPRRRVRPEGDDEDLADELLALENLEELLLEMKDVSELTVDLAYSCLIYRSSEIAEGVEDLEEVLDRLQRKVQRKALEEVRDGKRSIDHALILLRLASTAEVISDAARDIADVVSGGMELHPVLADAIRDSDSIVTRATVRPDSFFVARTLKQLRVESETGMRVIAIRRGRHWRYGPEADTVLEAGDLLIARGPVEGEKPFLAAVAGEIRQFA